jgi:hypothetical protein
MITVHQGICLSKRRRAIHPVNPSYVFGFVSIFFIAIPRSAVGQEAVQTPGGSTVEPPSGPTIETAEPNAAAEATGPEASATPGETPSFGATARVEKPRPDRRSLGTEELRTLPGAFGDPFRALETLPGVAPYLSGLPYVYVRGSPPAGTLFIYDEIPLPTLFHLGLGPAVIHPAMIGPIDFFSGVGPARYGRRTGGLFTSAYREADPTRGPFYGEAELRAIDVMGMVHAPLLKGDVTAAGRYGYPGLILSIVSPEISLAYWDYQLRLNQAIAKGTKIQVVWFGSYDSLSTVKGTDGLTLTFHRFEVRFIRDYRDWQYGLALLYGYDSSANDAGTVQDAQAGEMWARRIGPRVWLAWHNERHTRFRLGADMVGVVGDLSQNPPPAGQPQDNIPAGLRPYGTPPTDVYRGQFAFAQFDNPVYTSVAARNTAGAFTELGFRPARRWDLELGLRADLWLTGFRSDIGVDPRLLITHYVSRYLDLHAAIGLAHQPAVFLLPLPGVSDVALDRGLQRALQSELGGGLDLFGQGRVELQLFIHYYTDLLFPELTLEKFNQCGQSDIPTLNESTIPNICQSGVGFPRASALAYGGEFFLRRPITETISGWLSYTLTWADAESNQGFRFTPVYDTRHVVNLVLQYRPIRSWRLGIRVHARSGQMYTTVTDDLVRLERRLPGFYRIDAQAAYGWKTGFGRMELAVEWFNVTLSREPRSYLCGLDITDQNRSAPDRLCNVEYAPALFFPNLGLRAEF